MEVFTGPQRRGRWRDDQKLEILAEVGVQGATVADVARRHDVTRQHIYQWRREMRQKGRIEVTGAVFLPVEIDAPGAETAAEESGSISTGACGLAEIRLPNGRHLRVAADLKPAVLSRRIQTLEAALSGPGPAWGST
jgi:transposase